LPTRILQKKTILFFLANIFHWFLGRWQRFKKNADYIQDYLKFGFIASPTNESVPMCLFCEKTFSNDTMKPSKMKDHLERIHCDKKSKELDYFKTLKAKFRSRPRLEIFFKSPANADLQGGQKDSYNITLNIAKKGKLYCIGEK